MKLFVAFKRSYFVEFQLNSPFSPTGDQPTAIEQLVDGLNSGERAQVLLGVTGSGKTFTVANVIAQVNRPTLVLTHNKTLTAQLYGEFREFFRIMPSNTSFPITTTINPKPTCR